MNSNRMSERIKEDERLRFNRKRQKAKIFGFFSYRGAECRSCGDKQRSTETNQCLTCGGLETTLAKTPLPRRKRLEDWDGYVEWRSQPEETKHGST